LRVDNPDPDRVGGAHRAGALDRTYDPELTARRAEGSRQTSWAEQFAPLKKLQVWRFSL
jgi:hypothetical protein